MKLIMMHVAFAVCGAVHAASIVWGGGNIAYYAPGENWGYGADVQLYDWGLRVGDSIWVNVCMDVQQSYYGADFTFLMKSDSDRFLRLNSGEVIDSSTMAGAGMIDETMHVDYSRTVFVAFETDAHVGDSVPIRVYGWVEFGFSGLDGIVPVNGALDLDGGAMIVGGGAIPEPSSGLLVLFGFIGLMLKRQRAFPVP